MDIDVLDDLEIKHLYSQEIRFFNVAQPADRNVGAKMSRGIVAHIYPYRELSRMLDRPMKSSALSF
jgi:hypothetical protein